MSSAWKQAKEFVEHLTDKKLFEYVAHEYGLAYTDSRAEALWQVLSGWDAIANRKFLPHMNLSVNKDGSTECTLRMPHVGDFIYIEDDAFKALFKGLAAWAHTGSHRKVYNNIPSI